MEDQRRKVTSDGCVQMLGDEYYSEALKHHVGETVRCAVILSESKTSATIDVRDLGGHYITTARSK